MATPPARLRPPPVSSPDSEFVSNNRRPARMASINQPNRSIPLSEIKLVSNFSFHVLSELLEQLTREQEAMLAAAGMSFVLHLHLLRGYKVDRARAVWLLVHLRRNGERLVLQLPGRGEVEVTKDMVLDILGLPGGTKPVQAEGGLGRPTVKSNVAIGEHRLSISVRRAREVAESIAGRNSMSMDDRRAFLAAVMILSVGTFLAPTGSNCGEVDGAVLEAVSGRVSIGSYDWPGFVLNRLAHAGASVRSQIGQGCPEGKIYLSGCTLLLVMVYYSRWVGISFPKRVVGNPMISCFEASALKELDKVDLQRRAQFRSWNVLTNKRHFDTEAFINLVRPCTNNVVIQPLPVSSRPFVDVGSLAGGPRVGAQQTIPSLVAAHLSKVADAPNFVRNLVVEMIEKIVRELAENHGHVFGGPQVVTYGNEKLVSYAFDILEAVIKETKALFIGPMAPTALPMLDADIRGEMGSNAKNFNGTPQLAQCLGKNAGPMTNDGFHELANVAKAGGSGASSMVPTSQFVKEEMFPEEAIYDQTPGSAKYSAQVGLSIMGIQTPGPAKCSSNIWGGGLGSPVYDKSQSHQGSGSTKSGLDLIAEALSMQTSPGKRKRHEADGQVDDDQSDADGSVKEVSLNMIGVMKISYVEQMIVEINRHDGLVGVFQGAIENKIFRASMKQRVWVKFGSPVQLDLTGDEILYHFASAKPWDLKMMAGVVALFKELDDQVYKSAEGPRPRFFVDPRILGGGLFGARGYDAVELRELMDKPYFSFDPAKCEMAIAPALMDGGWMCLVVHLKESKVTVFQPYPLGAPGLIGTEQLTKLSEKVLAPLLQMIFAGSGVRYTAPSLWGFQRFVWRGAPIPRYIDQQAVVVSMFALLFDGKSVSWDMFKECNAADTGLPPRKGPVASFKWALCSHLLMRGGNETVVEDIIYG